MQITACDYTHMHAPSVMLRSQQVLQGGEGMPRGAAGSI